MKKSVVLTHGAFDLMHSNHIAALGKAKSLGTYLVVGVDSDRFVESHKRRPILDQEERLAQVKAVRYVDEAYIMEDWSPEILEEHLDRWDVDHYVYFGEGWDDLYAPAIDRGILRRFPYHEGISTTKIIETVKRRLT